MTVELVVYDPTGADEISQTFAPRLPDLNGKTIVQLSNSSFEVARTFPVIRALLQKRYPTAKIVPFTEFEEGRFDIDGEKNMARLKEIGADAVITGNAG